MKYFTLMRSETAEIFISEVIVMSTQVQRIAEMLEMLPEQEQNLALEFMKRIVLAWDPDFTKLTPNEAAELVEAEKSGYIDEKDIDWNDLDKYV